MLDQLTFISWKKCSTLKCLRFLCWCRIFKC